MTTNQPKDGATDMQRLAAELLTRLDQEFPIIRKKINEFAERLDEPSAKLNKAVHKEPYWFIAAALGLGFFFGKLRGRK